MENIKSIIIETEDGALIKMPIEEFIVYFVNKFNSKDFMKLSDQVPTRWVWEHKIKKKKN